MAAGVLAGGSATDDASGAGAGSGAGDLTAGFATAAMEAVGNSSVDARTPGGGCDAVGAPPLVPRSVEDGRSSVGRRSGAAPERATGLGGGLAMRAASSRATLGTMLATGGRAEGRSSTDAMS